MRIENDFIASEYHFVEPNSSATPDIKVSMSRNKDKDGGESFTLTSWGEWGKEEFQHDLSFRSRNEAIKFLKGMIAVIKAEYKDENENSNEMV